MPVRSLAEQEAEKKQTLDKLKKDHGWNDWPPQAEIAKLMEEKFPFEKLREMIDK